MPRSHKKLLIYSLIFLLPFSFLFLEPSVFVPFKHTVVHTISNPLRLILFPFAEIKKILSYRQTFLEYERLRKEVDTLKARLVGQEEVLRENNRLRELLGFKRSLVFSSVAAAVIGRDPSYWHEVILIDKGRDAGISVGMPVLTSLGIVGKVAEAGKEISKVILLTDPTFSVAALIEETRDSGLVSGTLQPELCKMRFLKEHSEVKVGDKVITSKLSFFFPEGLLIGEVVGIQRSHRSPTLECLIKPAVELSKIEEVLVIKR